MPTPIGQSLPQDLRDRGYNIVETLYGLGVEQQLNLACRTLLATLLLSRPSASVPKAQRDAGQGTSKKIHAQHISSLVPRGDLRYSVES